tara:strand:+ start:485 stop:757 length:273 start_codon:yes stop_codon:yes gene_type:complete
MAIISDFKATSIWKAFLLNSLVSALIILIAIIIKGKFDKYIYYKNTVKRKSTWTSIILTFLFTFLSTFAAYSLMNFIFGYGGGQLVSSAP